ncbi:hypothetical protein ES332_A12G203200v1 [Gossypium tomentosum]|uniref:Uncharacterized protein n=1 Tax=Gossypium tomentosum TaxID=34277 RepID=A0A5D2MZF0_GOSTO|nr:hypothetical protein ES332_A12G203200v1 [Gossypium tomentosum]
MRGTHLPNSLYFIDLTVSEICVGYLFFSPSFVFLLQDRWWCWDSITEARSIRVKYGRE